MLAWYREQQLLLEQRQRLERRMADRLNDHRHVELARLEQVQQRARTRFTKRQGDTGVASRERRQRERQQVGPDAWCCADCQRAAA